MPYTPELLTRLKSHLELIYPQEDNAQLALQVLDAFGVDDQNERQSLHLPGHEIWSEKSSILITYGDSLLKEGEVPLKTLHKFATTHLTGMLSGIHILPFSPYSSDAGFSVKDYEAVRDDLGTWADVKAIAADFRLMADLVINHASAEGKWFKGFLTAKGPYANFFMQATPDDDLSKVVRPRPYPLLTPFETAEGTKHLWCTFGPDQVDLNFKSPAVLLEFIKIMRFYIENGVRVFRFDAVAFLWKEVGTSSIHLPQTHEVVRLFRTLVDTFRKDVLLITETNVPNAENISYFGNQDEAHMVYNFALPPLLTHALLAGTGTHLKNWLLEMPTLPDGCTFFNFTASHDGIGLRPATGLLPEAEVYKMIDAVKRFGGRVSMRSTPEGDKPYEMNISLFEALKGTLEGEADALQHARFIASQTVMMGLEGVPAFYIHSLLATPNDYAKFEKSQHNRCLNRHEWDMDQLNQKLDDPQSDQSIVFTELKRRMKIRRGQKAFHPNAPQTVLQLPEVFFGFMRKNHEHDQTILCLTNMSKDEQTLPKHALGLTGQGELHDLLKDTTHPQEEGSLSFAPYQTMWLQHK